VWRQATAERPLLPLRVLRSRNVAGANLVQMLMIAGMLGVFFLAVLYLQRVLGYDAVRTGAAFLPISLSIGVLSLGFSARLNARFGPRNVLLPALVSMAAGLFLLSRVPVDGHYVADLLPAMVLLGIGGGLSFPALMTLAMSAAKPEDSGLASGLVNTTQQVGGALGLAILATVAENRTGSATSAAALVDGYGTAFTVASGLVVAALLVAVVVLRPQRVAATAEAAEPVVVTG
jgi:MFS family permease